MSTLKTKVVSAPINGATVESLALQTNNVDRVTVSPTGAVDVAGNASVGGTLTVAGSVAASGFVGGLTGAASDGIGQNQTWQNMAGLRAVNTDYTNTTGRPIYVSVRMAQSGSGVASLTVGGVSIAGEQQSGTTGSQTIGGIVPDNTTYRLVSSLNTIASWAELR